MIRAIFAVDQNGGMGKNGTLPWPKNKDDIRHFRDLTSGNVVVMGRKTWVDPLMPKPLPKRQNVVLSSFPFISFPPGVLVYNDLNKAKGYLEQCGKEVWVIGGVQTLWAFHAYIDQVVLTRFKIDYNCDVSINPNKYLIGFKLDATEDRDDISIETYSRRKNEE